MFFCYLLQSESSPRSFYVGFTVDPTRRIRQHNGEIKCGALKTSKKRPWKFIAIIGGFFNNVTALMFEWQWQHPNTSRLSKEHIKLSSRSLKAYLFVLNTLLSLRLWSQCNLTVYIFDSSVYKDYVRIYQTSKYHVISMTIGAFEDCHKEISRKAKVNNKGRSTTSAEAHTLGLSTECERNNPSITSSSSHETFAPPSCYVCHAVDTTLKVWECNCQTCVHLTCLAKANIPISPLTTLRNGNSVPDLSRNIHSSSNNSSGIVNESLDAPCALIPLTVSCPGCHLRHPWVNIVRSCFSREQPQAMFNSQDGTNSGGITIDGNYSEVAGGVLENVGLDDESTMSRSSATCYSQTDYVDCDSNLL